MRLYTVSAIESWIMMQGPKGTTIPRVGKNGGPLANTRGVISSLENCKAFVNKAWLDGCVSVSDIKHWKGA